MNDRSPDPIDIHVGTRIRTQRRLLRMTQTQLAEQLGITFQQVQTYEKGINRIGSGRLARLAEVLGVEITFFFEGDPNTRENNWKPLAEADPIFGFVGTAVGLELNQAFIAIKDDRVRRSIIKMTETLAKASAAPKD